MYKRQALVFAGCTATDETVDDQNNVEDVNTNEDANNENNADNEATEPQYQYIDKADVKAIIDESQAGYVLLDLRKAADYEAGHIVTAVSADVDSAVSNSDNDTATANPVSYTHLDVYKRQAHYYADECC